jgi:hypothetical protein
MPHTSVSYMLHMKEKLLVAKLGPLFLSAYREKGLPVLSQEMGGLFWNTKSVLGSGRFLHPQLHPLICTLFAARELLLAHVFTYVY